HINKQNIEDGLDLLLAAKQATIPTVTTVHVTRSMTDLKSRAGFLRDWVATRVLRRCHSHYITVAHHCRDQLISCCRGMDPGRVHTVWNGVASVPQADRQSIRAEWACRGNELVLGCVARLEPQKNPLFSLELLRALPNH